MLVLSASIEVASVLQIYILPPLSNFLHKGNGRQCKPHPQQHSLKPSQNVKIQPRTFQVQGIISLPGSCFTRRVALGQCGGVWCASLKTSVHVTGQCSGRSGWPPHIWPPHIWPPARPVNPAARPAELPLHVGQLQGKLVSYLQQRPRRRSSFHGVP